MSEGILNESFNDHFHTIIITTSEGENRRNFPSELYQKAEENLFASLK